MTMAERIRAELEHARDVQTRVAEAMAESVAQAAAMIAGCYREGGKLLLAGNGGSAADAQHIAGELVGRFLQERVPLAAVSLATDTSVLTGLVNDYSPEAMFARQVEALGREGDVLIALSTSGHSPNILAAVQAARDCGMGTIALLGDFPDRPLAQQASLALCVPSDQTPHIQQAHITILHAICGVVEEELFGPAEEATHT